MNFSQRLIFLRDSRELLQKDIASDSGIALRTYQYYEKSEREPSMSALLKLSSYFNVSIDYLVGRTDNPEINK